MPPPAGAPPPHVSARVRHSRLTLKKKKKKHSVSPASSLRSPALISFFEAKLSRSSTMADLQVVPPRSSATHGASVFHKLHEHAPPGSAHLVVADAVLLLLIGLTITAAVVGLILPAPLVIVSSPVWVPVPIAAVLFVAVAAVLSACGFGVIALAGVSWLYKYFTGSDLSGVGRGANARTGHVKDYAGEAFANSRVPFCPRLCLRRWKMKKREGNADKGHHIDLSFCSRKKKGQVCLTIENVNREVFFVPSDAYSLAVSRSGLRPAFVDSAPTSFVESTPKKSKSTDAQGPCRGQGSTLKNRPLS
ncbi:hypothetical protein NL676_029268 [Syzygium grande]|nr:hypothetical protein NL676_029268 [Syzygium grande]